MQVLESVVLLSHSTDQRFNTLVCRGLESRLRISDSRGPHSIVLRFFSIILCLLSCLLILVDDLVISLWYVVSLISSMLSSIAEIALFFSVIPEIGLLRPVFVPKLDLLMPVFVL